MQPYYPSPNETIYYQDASVFISSTRAVFYNQTFFIKNISSVSIEEVENKDRTPIVLIIGGLVLSCFGVAEAFNDNRNPIYFVIGALITLLGLSIFIWGEPFIKELGIKISQYPAG